MVWIRLYGVYFKFQCYNFYLQQGGYIILTVLSELDQTIFWAQTSPDNVIYLNAD